MNFNKTFTLPFQFQIPTFVDEFLSKKILIKARLKYFKRYFYIYLKGEHLYEISTILPQHKNILWINISAPSLGDSLMDLSSRIMLEDKNVDLFTDFGNAHLYEKDLFFSSIYTDPNKLKNSFYDLIIVDSFSSRSIRSKYNVARSTPYVSMFGYFNGLKVNRVLFSFHQMNHLLSYRYSEIEINQIAKSTISISKLDKDLIQKISIPRSFITFALGGEWTHRTYNNWIKVIESILLKDQDINIILVGSSNAVDIANLIMDRFIELNIYNFVSKFTFNQTSEVISKSRVLFCCDGGLMHAANSVNTPIIALFARLSPEMQLTESICAFSLYDDQDVNNISVAEVIRKYEKFKLFSFPV